MSAQPQHIDPDKTPPPAMDRRGCVHEKYVVVGKESRIEFQDYTRPKIVDSREVGLVDCVRVEAITGGFRSETREETKIKAELPMEALQEFLAVSLNQRQKAVFENKRSGKKPKTVTFERFSAGQAKGNLVGRFMVQSGETNHSVGLNTVALWHFQMIAASLLQRLYPSLPADMLMRSFVATGSQRKGEGGQNG